MNNAISNTRLVLLALFLVASIATIGYQAWAIWPMQRCEKTGAWWDAKDRQCLAPIPIWRITGRLPATPSTPPKAPAPHA